MAPAAWQGVRHLAKAGLGTSPKSLHGSVVPALDRASLCLYYIVKQKALWEPSCKIMFLVLVRALCNDAEALQALFNCEFVSKHSVMQWVRGRTAAEIHAVVDSVWQAWDQRRPGPRAIGATHLGPSISPRRAMFLPQDQTSVRLIVLWLLITHNSTHWASSFMSSALGWL